MSICVHCGEILTPYLVAYRNNFTAKSFSETYARAKEEECKRIAEFFKVFDFKCNGCVIAIRQTIFVCDLEKKTRPPI